MIVSQDLTCSFRILPVSLTAVTSSDISIVLFVHFSVNILIPKRKKVHNHLPDFSVLVWSLWTCT